MHGSTLLRICTAVGDGTLHQPFRPKDVNEVLGIQWAGTFLPKHREGNPGGYNAFFKRVARGLYRLLPNVCDDL